MEVECDPNETNTDEDMERVRDGSPELNRGLSNNGWESEELISLNGTNNERDKNEIGSCGPLGHLPNQNLWQITNGVWVQYL